MSGEARFLPRAELDLIEQATHLLEEAGPDLSDRFLEAARQTAAHLTATPHASRAWKSEESRSDSAIRIWPVEGFPKMLLFYRPEEFGIVVIRVLHSSRDLPPLLDSYV